MKGQESNLEIILKKVRIKSMEKQLAHERRKAKEVQKKEILDIFGSCTLSENVFESCTLSDFPQSCTSSENNFQSCT